MDQEETKNDSPPNSDKDNEVENLKAKIDQLSGELTTIKDSLEKRKSETTTLKILFYTALGVLLFGFIYSNQTLQRAQHSNLEANITALQSQINHNLLSLETKLHEKIIDLETQSSEKPDSSLHNSIKSMNHALSELKPETQTMDELIRKVKKESEELSKLIKNEKYNKNFSPEPVP
ncbi:MAG: hypothetical protein VW455_01700 [Nitrospinota bacterium]